MKQVVFFGALIGLIFIGAASADDFPSMVGTWGGTSKAVVLGDARYYSETADKTVPRLSDASFTLELTHQEGRLFWGTLTSSRITEAWIGTFWNDGVSFQAVGARGQVVGRMTDANTMEMIYTQTGPTLITSHAIFSRQ